MLRGTPPVSLAELTDLTAVGLWEQVGERTGRTQSWFKITERGGVYEGTLVQVSPTCEGAGACFLGLTLTKGIRRNGNWYDNGTITGPRDGSLYSALMRLSPDAQKLEVRGYQPFRCSVAARFGIGCRMMRLPSVRSGRADATSSRAMSKHLSKTGTSR
jgi:Uncharacterized protein conserved in bacteria (DUF2147)